MADLLKEQDERKSSIESRSMSVITSAGALVGLMFALVAVITGADTFSLPSDAKLPLAVAIILLLGCGSLAVAAMAPRSYKNATTEGLAELKQHWSDSELDARRRVFATKLNVFSRAQAANECKAKVLQAAIVVEVLGVAAVGVAVLVIITQG
jgi:hypothetical protein